MCVKDTRKNRLPYEQKIMRIHGACHPRAAVRIQSAAQAAVKSGNRIVGFHTLAGAQCTAAVRRCMERRLSWRAGIARIDRAYSAKIRRFWPSPAGAVRRLWPSPAGAVRRLWPSPAGAIKRPGNVPAFLRVPFRAVLFSGRSPVRFLCRRDGSFRS